MKKIALGGKFGKGKFALVDDEDYEKVIKFKWYLSHGYVVYQHYLCKDGKRIYSWLHRLVMDAPKGMDVDHINRNKLDNRKQNLRICTHPQNLFNSKDKGGSSQFKGVAWNKYHKKWQAYIGKDYKKYRLGYFNVEEDAAKAYDLKAKELFGEFAYLNFK